MAANPKLPMSASAQEPYHIYHAEAYILKGELEQPIKQPIQRGGIMYNFCELQYLQALAE